MRVQINNGKLNEYSQNTIIAIGTCTGENTFEIACEIPENFENEFWMYEAVIKEDKVTELCNLTP